MEELNSSLKYLKTKTGWRRKMKKFKNFLLLSKVTRRMKALTYGSFEGMAVGGLLALPRELTKMHTFKRYVSSMYGMFYGFFYGAGVGMVLDMNKLMKLFESYRTNFGPREKQISCVQTSISGNDQKSCLPNMSENILSHTVHHKVQHDHRHYVETIPYKKHDLPQGRNLAVQKFNHQHHMQDSLHNVMNCLKPHSWTQVLPPTPTNSWHTSSMTH